MNDSARPIGDGWDGKESDGNPDRPSRGAQFADERGARWTIRSTRDGMADGDALDGMYDAFGSRDRAQGVPPVDDRRRRSWIGTLLEEGSNVVVEGRGQLVGHAVYTPTTDETPELAVFVHPDRRGRGIGTELCKRVIAEAAEAGREALVLHVEPDNRAACTVYRRLGFETVERDRELRMRLPLDEPSASSGRDPPTGPPRTG